jgi:hypothetical protein
MESVVDGETGLLATSCSRVKRAASSTAGVPGGKPTRPIIVRSRNEIGANSDG